MFKKLFEKLKKLQISGSEVDPLIFNDALAMTIDWKPLKGGGANFKTHNLVELNSFRLEFRPSIGAKIFYSLFLVIGLAVLFFYFVIGPSLDVDTAKNEFILPLAGFIFSTVGGFLLYFGTAPIVFDKRQGCYWKGRRSLGLTPKIGEVNNYAILNDIHALQLISEYISGNKSHYYSYELNLVLNHGQRINVVDHGNLRNLRADAVTLSNFLNKPVWDAI